MRANAGKEIDAARAKYPTSKDGIKEAGLIPVATESKPPFVWIDGILTKDESFDYEPYQKCSKIPGMDYMCYKSSLFTALNEMSKYYPTQFNVYPKTFNLPQEFLEFQRTHMTITSRTQQPPTWVVKPRNSCCGNGITIVQSLHEASNIDEQAVIQQYVKPFLINGRKFDFRLYLLIASMDPLRIFIYKEGIARFCSEPFQMPTRANKADKFMHLTNTAINVENGDAKPEDFTKKASEVFEIIHKSHPEGHELWSRICACGRAVVIAILPKLISLFPKQRESRLIPLYIQRRPRFSHHPEKSDVKVRPSSPRVDENQKEQESETSETETTETETTDNTDNSEHLPLLKVSKALRGKEQPYETDHIVRSMMKRKGMLKNDFSSNRRSFSVSPDHSSKYHSFTSRFKQSHPIPPAIPEESEEVETSETSADGKKKKGPKPLPPKQRYFHILGIDIILNSELQPLVLELNDRPSLSVTVDFEKDLKTSFIRDAFDHVTPTGASNGETETSGWQQIFPLKEDDKNYDIWNEIAHKATHPKPNGEIDAVPAAVARPPPVGLGSTQPPRKKRKSKKSKKSKKQKDV